MKVVVISLLLASCLATTQLTPNTKISPFFDDMVFNSLGGLRNLGNPKTANVVVSNLITSGDAGAIRAFIKAQGGSLLSADNLNEAVNQIATLSKIMEDCKVHITHTNGDSQTLKTISIIATQAGLKKIKLVIMTDVRKVLGLTRDSVYIDVTPYKLGLPVDQPRVIYQKNALKPAFYSLAKRDFASAIIHKRGSQKVFAQGVMNLGAEGESTETKPAEGEKKEEGTSLASIITGAKNVVQQLAEGYKSIAEAFKTVKKEEIKEKLTGEGFSEYSSKSRYLRSIGIPKTYWETYKQQFMQLTGIAKNPTVKPDIEALLKMASFIQDNAWNTNDLTFDVTKGGTCSNFVCLTRYDSVIQKYHIMTTVVDGTFQLAPNIWIYSKYKSVAGGIVETTKITTKNMPRTLTEADAKAVNAMMLLTSINVMQENFGVPKTLPEFSEIAPTTFKK